MLKNLDDIGVSIVIVTYNGGGKLVPTLRCLANQDFSGFDLELLLVDNNSTDTTVTVAQETWRQLGNPYELRIVHESQSGTMYARRKGIEESRYRYLLYCDDDNWLNNKYVSTAFSIIAQNNQIAAVGGKGIMEYEKGFSPPKWIEAYEKNYGTTAQGSFDGDTTDDKGCLYTAGAILDRQWLNTLYAMGFQSSLQGRDGKTLIAGEDTELTYALKMIGGRLYYSSKMTFQHYMPKERINWNYLRRLWKSFGYSNTIISPYNYYFSGKKIPHEGHKIIKNLKILIRLTVSKYKSNSREGQHIDLELEKKKGELQAMIFRRKQYKSVQKTIVQLHQKLEFCQKLS